MNTVSIRSLLRFSTLALITSILLAVGTLSAHAQFRTSVQGVVTDPSGAVIPNAKLTLKDNATNETTLRTSDSAGVFNFNALPADSFTLTVESAGFQKKTLSNLQFIPEQENSLTVKLRGVGYGDGGRFDGSCGGYGDVEHRCDGL